MGRSLAHDPPSTPSEPTISTEDDHDDGEPSDSTDAAGRRLAPARDRDDTGRPEQARPRDRTGRPLPYDYAERAPWRGREVLLTEEHEYATRDEALATGMRLWDEGRFFEAHECLEDVWHEAAPGDRAFWKGVIQVAVGCVHDQRDNAEGAVTLLHRAAEYLAPYPTPHHGIRTAQLRDRALAMARRIAADGTGTVPHPSVPTTPDGPFVGDGPDDGPHPLRDDPAWRRAPRGPVPDGSTTDGATP